MSDGRMCPHCNRPLPDEATFCNECGRRVEGWQGKVHSTEAPDPSALPDGETETKEMNISPEMLRAAGKKKAAAAAAASAAEKKSVAASPAPSSDEPLDSSQLRSIGKRRASLMPLFVIVGAVAMGVLVFVVARQRQLAANPPVPPTNAVENPPPVDAPPPATANKNGKKKTPKKLAAEAVEKGAKDTVETLPPKSTSPTPPPTTGTTAPPKDNGKPTAPTKDNGKPAAPTKDKPSAPKPSLPDEDLPSEATPMTEDELKEQETARVNADQVRYVVKQHLSQVRACYERQFKQSSPGGRLEVSFAVGEDGKAKRVRSDVNTTGSEPFARCIEGLVGGWTFPRPVGGEFELTYPFVFSSGS